LLIVAYHVIAPDQDSKLGREHAGDAVFSV
jgi:hypothetical protein